MLRLSRNELPVLARRIVNALIADEAIEVVERREVERDVESVLGNYLNDIDRVQSRARELAQSRGLPQGEFGRIKQLAADQAGIKIGDDALDYVLEQLLQMLMQSANVDEVFAADHELKRSMRRFLRADESAEQSMEAEIRGKLKHVQEGSRTWEIEYQRIREEIKRRRGS